MNSIINTFREPVICIDNKCNISEVNSSAVNILEKEEKSLIAQPIQLWLKGVDLTLYFSSENQAVSTQRVTLHQHEFIVDIQPLTNTEEQSLNSITGAVLVFKSKTHLAKQLDSFTLPKEDNFSNIQANSSAMRKVIREAKRMSELEGSILIMGETGTGKEVFAKACHSASHRAQKPFMTLSCAALPDEAAEFELFGVGENEKVQSARGIFELADGGTVFLDEIGEMSPKLQSKLLRVIQNGSFRRVNSDQEITVDVRIISSTNKDLLNLIAQGEFREDLYYRLNVFGLSLPALRDRQSDILPLAEHFIEQACMKTGRTKVKMSESCREYVEQYPWPGNTRQLDNVITRAASLLEGDEILKAHLQLPENKRTHSYLKEEFKGTLEDALKDFEAEVLRNLYPKYPSSRQLAKKLGLSHTAIANKLREYQINKNTVKC